MLKLSKETVFCTACARQLPREDAVCLGAGVLCLNCYDEQYTSCGECGRPIMCGEIYYEEEGGTPYCHLCFHEREKTEEIHEYGYKPDPIFYGEGALCYGVELEIDKGGECRRNAAALVQIANEEHPHIYIKHDGSIDNGFEIVTHPMTLAYHRERMPWERLLQKCVSLGYQSHLAACCGLHIHINRNALGACAEQQEEVIGRIIFFVEQHWEVMLRFSRRTREQIGRWASRCGISSGDFPSDVLKNAKDQCDRYCAVNLQNGNTVEIRIFRGTLRYQTLMATLQMVDEICRAAFMIRDESFQTMTWQDFVAAIDAAKKPELIDYLKSRRLYVNEPVADEEEI